MNNQYNMKTKILFILLFVLFVTVTGCQHNSQKYKAGNLPVIDISKTYPEKEVIIQDIANVEYVPLETTDSVLIGKGNLSYISGKYIVLKDISQNAVFVFSRNGKIVSHFNEEKKIRGELDESVKIPDEDDNPVVMIVKLK